MTGKNERDSRDTSTHSSLTRPAIQAAWEPMDGALEDRKDVDEAVQLMFVTHHRFALNYERISETARASGSSFLPSVLKIACAT